MSYRKEFWMVTIMIVGSLATGFAGGVDLAREALTKDIAQACARDKSFELVRGGITWTYTCSNPRIVP